MTYSYSNTFLEVNLKFYEAFPHLFVAMIVTFKGIEFSKCFWTVKDKSKELNTIHQGNSFPFPWVAKNVKLDPIKDLLEI